MTLSSGCPGHHRGAASRRWPRQAQSASQSGRSERNPLKPAGAKRVEVRCSYNVLIGAKCLNIEFATSSSGHDVMATTAALGEPVPEKGS